MESALVRKGRMRRCDVSAVPSGLIPGRALIPNVETSGYARISLRDKHLVGSDQSVLLHGRPRAVLPPRTTTLAACRRELPIRLQRRYDVVPLGNGPHGIPQGSHTV